MYLCMFETYLLLNGWTDLKILFLLVSSWSVEGFRQKKFWIFEKKIADFFAVNFE